MESIHAVAVEDLKALFRREVDTADCRNIADDSLETIELSDFVPHETSYFEAVASYFG
ncbi:hypothetical protein [Sporosarcina sp. Te-1]|uniref:hypothetical protein n=1 Tax=Sporosarcina sp. Te-1 TaxID=2818390 RepID=UPI001A9EA988|nr:hypothetical protein [Sporosarcina sp. Te-1]QTD40191.1 hypothetical protein J3U78_15420 [Sporosarcina sp. Te-1]